MQARGRGVACCAVRGARSLLVTAASCALFLLTACPLSDDYYLEPSELSGGSAGQASGGTAGDMVTGGAGTGGAQACAPACSGGRACLAGVCQGGWTTIAEPPPGFVPREKAASATFDRNVFIFGGLDAQGNVLDSGAIYSPRTNSWKLIARGNNSPEPRQLAGAVWTGSRMLVWGGKGSATQATLRSGALYDPATDTWSAIPQSPQARVAPVAGSAVGRVLFWGGSDTSGNVQERAERFLVTERSWESVPTVNDPGRLSHAAWAFTSDSLVLYGGRVDGAASTDTAARYSFTANAWSTLPRGPSPRWGAFGVADGMRLYVWGGRNEQSLHMDGKLLGAAGWSAMATLGAPAARWAPHRQSGWAFALAPSSVVFLGGLGANDVPLRDGGRYDTATNVWRPMPAWPDGEAHSWAVGIWTGSEFVLWGGRDGARVTSTGSRWAP